MTTIFSIQDYILRPVWSLVTGFCWWKGKTKQVPGNCKEKCKTSSPLHIRYIFCQVDVFKIIWWASCIPFNLEAPVSSPSMHLSEDRTDRQPWNAKMKLQGHTLLWCHSWPKATPFPWSTWHISKQGAMVKLLILLRSKKKTHSVKWLVLCLHPPPSSKDPKVHIYTGIELQKGLR